MFIAGKYQPNEELVPWSPGPLVEGKGRKERKERRDQVRSEEERKKGRMEGRKEGKKGSR